jgi:hypothetical protein
VEGYRHVYSEIASTKHVPEQRHWRLSRTRAKDGAIVPKKIS